MIRSFCLSSLLLLPLFAQVPDKIDIDLDGKPFTTFHSGVAEGRPFLAPIRSASGKIITRRWPMEKVPGESNDHRHHRGLWFSYDDVNGVKFWENDPTYVEPKVGRIVAKKVDWKPGFEDARDRFRLERSQRQNRSDRTPHRQIQGHTGAADHGFRHHLTAPEKVVFGDTKEGAFAIRLADALTEKSGSGKMVNADGKQGMAERLGQTLQLGGLLGHVGWRKARDRDLRSSLESRPSDALARARLRIVRRESVGTTRVRSVGARRQHHLRGRWIAALSLARGDP